MFLWFISVTVEDITNKMRDIKKVYSPLIMKVLLAVILFVGNLVFIAHFGEAANGIPSHIRSHPKIIWPDSVFRRWAASYPSAYVIVNLKRPADFTVRVDWNRPEDRERRRRSVVNAQARALERLRPERVRPTGRFEYIPAFAAEVTIQGLEDLLALDEVESIEEDRILELHTKQGIPLMNASTVRTTYDGQGVSIAIVDSGIDYTHPSLGGGGFPNSKVIGGYDYGGSQDRLWSQDADPMDVYGHGTNCAGIAAGYPGGTGDYIGGVAPGAKLYAVKVTYGTTNQAFTSDMIAGWEWCITHKNDNPDYPIMVISTSLGSGNFSSQCDDYSPSLTEAAANIVDAGITIFASSGNEGSCDSIASPACISHVISVGAVFDANLGLGYCVNPDSCAKKEPNTGCATGYVAWANAADKEPPYSNFASFLGLFAPSNNASTTTLGGGYTTNFGGTSAASPYAAGAAAVIQDAAKTITGQFLSPAQVRSILIDTGDLVTNLKNDAENSYGKQRINVGNAVDSLMATGDPPSVPAISLPALIITVAIILAMGIFYGRSSTL